MRLIGITILLLVLALLSCKPDLIEEKDLQSNQAGDGYEIVDGILHFENNNTFVKAVNLAGEGKFLIGSKKFVSFYDAYVADKVKAEEDLKDSSRNYVQSKFVKIVDNHVEINFSTEALSKVCSIDGIVYVGKSLMRFTDKKQFILKSGGVVDALKLTDSSISNDNVLVISTDVDIPEGHKNARAASMCRRLFGMAGNQNVGSDASKVAAYVKRMSTKIENDQYMVYYSATVTGDFENTGWFDGSSDNNALTTALTLDIYDPYGNLRTSNSIYNYSVNKGQHISYTSPYFYGTTCFSFQVLYTFANFREGTINPYPDIPCGIQANCRQSFPIYKTDKHTITAGCTNDTSN